MADPVGYRPRIQVVASMDVDPDSTLPPAGSPVWDAVVIPDDYPDGSALTSLQGPLQCPNYVLFKADQQEAEYISPTGLRTLTVATKAPAIRLPGTITNVGLVEEHLTRVARDRIPLQCRSLEFNRGSIELGDSIDTSTVSEMAKSLARERRIEAWDQTMRMRGVATGNHDVMANGTTDSGRFYTGINVLGMLMDADGPNENYRSEIVKEEAGSEANISDKEKFLRMVQKQLGLSWQPVPILSADDTTYHLPGESKSSRWSDDKLTVKNFWREHDNGEFWQATIKFNSDDKELKPDQQYLGISFVKLDENTYSILMDTTDLLEDWRINGLLQGHLSYVQVRLIQSLMRHLKSQNPKAKFVLNSHYPLDNLDQSIYQVPSAKNHLEEILNDESVVAVIVAHTHRWGMKDLNAPLKIKRRTPLLQYNVTSMMDWPVGAAQMTVQSDSQYLTLALHRIDFERTLPEMDADGRKKFDEIDAELLSFATAWRHMTDARFKLLGHPRAKFPEQSFVAADFHDGLIPEPGRFYDLLMTQDAIPVEAVQGMVTMRHDQDIFVLELNTVEIQNPLGEPTSLRSAATVVDEEFQKYLQNLRNFYLNGLVAYRSRNQERAREARSRVEPLRKVIDESTKTTTRAYQEVMRQLEVGMLPLADKKKTGTISRTETDRLDYLKNLHDIAFTAIVRAEAAKDWFLRFGIKLAQGQKEEDLSHMNDLRSLPYWRDMDRLIQNLPYNRWGTDQVSPATAYRLHIHERSAQRRAKYLGKEPHRNVPPVVTIKINLATNEIITLTGRLPDYTPDERKRIIDSWGSPTDLTGAELDEARQVVDQRSEDFRRHTAIQIGPRFAPGTRAARFGFGQQFHWSLRDGGGQKTWKRITVAPMIEYTTNGDEILRVDNRVRELGGSVAGYLEALGWLGVGAAVSGAASWNSPDRSFTEAVPMVGGDLRVQIADGALIAYGGTNWYSGDGFRPMGGFMIDPIALLDTFNVDIPIPWLGIHYGKKPKPPQLENYPAHFKEFVK